MICNDTAKYGVEHVPVPSDFFCGIYQMFVTDAIYPLIRAEKEMLGKIQKDDGGFDISWNGRADVRNIASNKVLEKCGFIKEGTI